MDTPRLFLLATVSGCLFGPLAAQEAPRKVKRIAAPAARLIPAGAPTPKSQDELRAAFDKKLASAFVKNAGWITDFDAAHEIQFAGPMHPRDAVHDWRPADRRRRAAG